MITNLLSQAATGVPLWLPDLRERFATEPNTEKLIIRLSDGKGKERDYTLFLPKAQGMAEKTFLLRFTAAQIYNLLSAYSAREVCLFCGEEEQALLSALPALFDKPTGFGKVRNIARRIHGDFEIVFASPSLLTFPIWEKSCVGSAAARKKRAAWASTSAEATSSWLFLPGKNCLM